MQRWVETVEMQMSPGMTAGAVQTFLDLGAAPGAWSYWLLSRNEGSVGVGVEMPRELGGREVLWEEWGEGMTKGRYFVLEADIMDLPYDLNDDGTIEDNAKIIKLDVGMCDAVMCGAVPLDIPGTVSASIEAHRSPKTLRLALQQLALAFVYLKTGGTLVTLAWKKTYLANFEIVLLLRDSFESLTPCKGLRNYATNSAYILVSRGFDASKRKEGIRKLDRALKRLSNLPVGSEAKDNGVLFVNETEEDMYAREGQWIREFYEPLWKAQEEAILERVQSK
jgi:hypothetical protein